MSTILSIFIILLLHGCATLQSDVMKDDFPASHVNRQLSDAKKAIKVDMTMVKPGQFIMVEYVDMPVWIYRRTSKDLEYLSQNDKSKLADPSSLNLMSSIEAAYGSSSSYVWARLLLVNQPEIEREKYRSISDEFLVIGGWGTHSGCNLNFSSPVNRNEEGVAFYDPCVGAYYDVAGRILKACVSGMADGQNAVYNLYIPPHKYNGNETLTIGIPKSSEIPEINVSMTARYLGLNPTEKLITASLYNDRDTVQQAIKEGADVNFYAYGEGSPIDAAIIGSSIEVINLLIANGAKPTANSLYVAEFVGRDEVVKLIKEMEK